MQGHKVNPCNSQLHPAVTEAGIAPDGSEEICIQEAYTPNSLCFGCGQANKEGLRLRSYRAKNGLRGYCRIPANFCAFPGIVNGGIVSSVLDCHGNWTAAIALMDRSVLPKPPLTLTASMFVNYKEPTPPDADLVVISQVMSVKESAAPGMGKASVEVDVSLYLQQEDGSRKLLVSGTGVFKRLGALRAV